MLVLPAISRRRNFYRTVYFGCNVIAALSLSWRHLLLSESGLLIQWFLRIYHAVLRFACCRFCHRRVGGRIIASEKRFLVHGHSSQAGIHDADRARRRAPSRCRSHVFCSRDCQGIAPCLTGFFMTNAVTGLPIVLAGLFKSVYDVSLYHAFKHVPFHDEQADRAPLMSHPPPQ